MTAADAEFSDVLIIGAGISGIGAAYRIHEKNPGLSYTVLERRARIGGTWDLFRYPGIRSDSDIFTLSFPYEPWRRPENVADGQDIREYLTETARKNGIDEHIRFNTRVISADWDSTTDTWTVQTEQDGRPKSYRGRFLFFGTGYYNYDEPYRPEFPGIENFAGEVVHPQFWPESLDYTGKRVVVIGSGATAVSMIPSLTEKAGHVTMLQRSPTYMLSMPRIHPVVQAIRKVLPLRARQSCCAAVQHLLHRDDLCGRAQGPEIQQTADPGARAKSSLPEGYPVDIHFKPRYDPWDQRLCLILDGDLYTAVGEGRAEVVTDHIDHIDGSGIVLKSGRPHRRRRDRHRDRPAVAGAGRRGDQHRRRGGQAAGPVRLQGAHARRHSEHGVVRRLHQRVVDVAGRHDRARGGETVGVHGRSRLHARLPASWRQADAGEAGVEHQRRLRTARGACAAEIGHTPAVECAAQLRARRHRPPLRPDRGVDGVRPSSSRASQKRLTTTLASAGYRVRSVTPVPSNWDADSPNVVLNRSARCDGLAKPAFIAAAVRSSPAAMAAPACIRRTHSR